MDGLNQIKRFRSVLFLFGAASLCVGCGTPIGQSAKNTDAPVYVPSVSTSSAAGSAGPVNDTIGFAVTDPDTLYPNVMHMADQTYAGNQSGLAIGVDNFETPCSIAQGTSPGADILCILEVGELDLYFQTVNFHINVPSGMCSYLKSTPYEFYGFQPGNGPSNVSWEVNADGSISNQSNAPNGIPYCVYDHSYNDAGGPNCCVGQYTQTVYTISSSGAVVPTSTTQDWKGSAANCLSGPGMSQAKDVYGFPESTVISVAASGATQAYAITPAISSTTTAGTQFSSNIWAANFYRGADYSAQGVKSPIPMQSAANLTSGPGAGFVPNDSYTYECLDQAQEVQARIRIMIRNWHQEPTGGSVVDGEADGVVANFPEIGACQPGSPLGTPAGVGVLSGVCLPDPNYPTDALDNHHDWIDYFSSTYGNNYPGFYQ